MAGERVLRDIIPEQFFVEAERVVAKQCPEDPVFSEIRMEWSHQTIFQKAAALRASIYVNERYGDPINQKLLDDLKREIAAKGGVAAVDRWLMENDPRHNLLRDIKNLDTSILE